MVQIGPWYQINSMGPQLQKSPLSESIVSYQNQIDGQDFHRAYSSRIMCLIIVELEGRSKHSQKSKSFNTWLYGIDRVVLGDECLHATMTC